MNWSILSNPLSGNINVLTQPAKYLDGRFEFSQPPNAHTAYRFAEVIARMTILPQTAASLNSYCRTRLSVYSLRCMLAHLTTFHKLVAYDFIENNFQQNSVSPLPLQTIILLCRTYYCQRFSVQLFTLTPSSSVRRTRPVQLPLSTNIFPEFVSVFVVFSLILYRECSV